jgi:hypothetical protein
LREPGAPEYQIDRRARFCNRDAAIGRAFSPLSPWRWKAPIEEGEEPPMQTQSPIFDEIAKLMSEAAGAVDGVRREAETVARSQLQRLLSDMDLVPREEFEAVREMAIKAREENERLAARIADLEARIPTVMGKTS